MKEYDMKLSTIKSSMLGQMSFDSLISTISDDIKEYTSSARIGGKSRPVYLEEDTDLNINESNFKTLCVAFLSGKINEAELNYIADALLLSNRVIFENDQLQDKLGHLTDPEINGHLTKEVVLELLNQVK